MEQTGTSPFTTTPCPEPHPPKSLTWSSLKRSLPLPPPAPSEPPLWHTFGCTLKNERRHGKKVREFMSRPQKHTPTFTHKPKLRRVMCFSDYSLHQMMTISIYCYTDGKSWDISGQFGHRHSHDFWANLICCWYATQSLIPSTYICILTICFSNFFFLDKIILK